MDVNKMGKQWKYQLKYNDGTTLEPIYEADEIYYILDYVAHGINTDTMKRISLWMNGQVLD